MRIFKIDIKKITEDPNGMLSSKIVSKCYFCQKQLILDSFSFINLHKLSSFKEVFCGFCVRNGFNNRSNKDVLVLSFKSILSYYYSQNYRKIKNMWVSEVRDLAQAHKEAGLKNPAFHYDDDSMNWFINFARVGETKKRINIENVYKTTISIIDSLRVNQIVSKSEEDLLKQKYLDAIDLFNKKRYRPKNKRILSPRISNFREEISFKNYE